MVFAAPESASDASPIIRLAFSSKKPSASREHPQPALTLHPACPSHRAFLAPAYAAEPGDAVPGSSSEPRLWEITTALSPFPISRDRMGLPPRVLDTAPRPPRL
ncbi:hypothetical protein FIBSPDRAFT_874483 [Athelia psychrophila]|uniref:Uncharacterized protein n=1 Tax=Athelia psychrophila TaxID=1759441 RepID=A0A165XHH3_9AGAM|nr:hypothetical protein FIBSPDRAFT_874483 [Fibularhizoctonia sp. CBS 109695]